VTDGKIVFVGDSKQSMTWAMSDTQVISTKGKMLLLEFIDAHNHVFEAGGGCLLSHLNRPSSSL
jgi:predicted amidohydrolase YtcJ